MPEASMKRLRTTRITKSIRVMALRSRRITKKSMLKSLNTWALTIRTIKLTPNMLNYYKACRRRESFKLSQSREKCSFKIWNVSMLIRNETWTPWPRQNKMSKQSRRKNNKNSNDTKISCKSLSHRRYLRKSCTTRGET